MLTSCASVESSIQQLGVSEGESAILCVRANIEARTSGSGARYSMLELPSDLKLQELSPEQLEAIRDIANTLGCTNSF